MRKVSLTIVSIIVALIVAGASWLAWRVWPQHRADSPVLILQVNNATEVKVLQGNPLVFSAYLGGSASTSVLRIGSPSHPWHFYLKMESVDIKQPLPWRLLLLGSPQSFSLEPNTADQLAPGKSTGEETVVSSDRLYMTELGADPKEAASVDEGRYAAIAVLDIPFWPPWRWSGRVVSNPVIVSVLKQDDRTTSTADLERMRTIESAEFYIKTTKFQEAYNLALQVQAREPEKVLTYLLLGDSLNGLKQDQEALDAYDYALYLSALEPQREPPEYLLMRKYEVERRLGLQQ
jgi:hypothetical protein